jgi:peptidoglycan/LPS O-acetylase OafA/YrhL
MYWVAMAIMCYFLWGFLDWPMALPLFSLAPTNVSEFVAPAWSLRYEMAFYLMFGLCLLPYIGRPLLAAWMLAVTWTWFPPLQLPLIGQSASSLLAWLGTTQASFFVAPFEFYFFAGLLGGWVFSAHPPGLRTSIAMLTAGIASLLLSWKQLDFGYSFGPPTLAPITGIAIACILTGFSSLERCGALRLGRWARQLGVISYPIYILHSPLLLVFDVQFEQMRLNHAELYMLLVGLIIAVIAICAAIAFAVDQPLQRALRRFNMPLIFRSRSP